MDNDLISRSALLEDIAESVVFSATACTYAHQLRAVNKVTDRIKAAPAVDAVEVGNCNGCMWEGRKRPQKCSCCRRAPKMKDCYEERKPE